MLKSKILLIENKTKTEWITAGMKQIIKRRNTSYQNLKNTSINSLDYEQKKIHSEENLLPISLY